jgi:RNA polymerase sigma factor (sigma-70 family)
VDDRETEDLLRPLVPRVLGALVRRYGHLDLAEDAVQEALLAAVAQWPADGIPDNPRGWLITVASRRLTDLLRAEQARRRREEVVAGWVLPQDWPAPAADRSLPGEDDTLVLLLMCCHAALDASAQVALTLRAVGGLTTREIARAFLVPEATMTRRITRAKQRIRSSPEPFALPRPQERAGRVAAALHVLYLIFNEGYSSTSGSDLYRVDLSTEAIRLARLVQQLLPDDGEAAGLLALMLLTEARRPARTDPAGQLIPMARQDRSQWNAAQIAEGVALITEALPRGPVGPYQLQAAIAAVHDEAPSADATDWPQIKALYEVLLRLSDNPVVRLNHAVAVAMVDGPAAGLARLDALDHDDRMAQDHRLHAVRGHLLQRAGDPEAATAAYLAAAERTTNVALQRYLHHQAGRPQRRD